MTGGGDDIAGSLPRPPLPAPARREAAIAEALRRFDGGAARPAQDRRPAGPRWLGPGRPYAGALAGAFLVALIGLPFVWTSFDRYVAEDGRGAGAGVEAPPSPPAMADAAPAADAAPPGPEAVTGSPAAADEVPADEDSSPAPVPAPRRAEAPAGTSEEPAADFTARDDGEIVVTGSRIRNPNLESSSPVTAIGGEAIAVTGSRTRRGDWNACTADDPKRDLRACRRDVASVARGASGKAAAHLAEGLSRSWEGEWEAAIASFDRAIELAPRSAAAYLNRGLAWRRLGKADRALADLDRAVLYAPQAARGYFQRSLLLRQRGDRRRARADEERAVELDPRYAAVVRAARRQAR